MKCLSCSEASEFQKFMYFWLFFVPLEIGLSIFTAFGISAIGGATKYVFGVFYILVALYWFVYVFQLRDHKEINCYGDEDYLRFSRPVRASLWLTSAILLMCSSYHFAGFAIGADLLVLVATWLSYNKWYVVMPPQDEVHGGVV